VVSAIATEGGWLETPLSADFEEALRGIPASPASRRTESFRARSTRARASRRWPSARLHRLRPFRRQVVGGDPREAVRAITQREGVAISDNLAIASDSRPAIHLPPHTRASKRSWFAPS